MTMTSMNQNVSKIPPIDELEIESSEEMFKCVVEKNLNPPLFV